MTIHASPFHNSFSEIVIEIQQVYLKEPRNENRTDRYTGRQTMPKQHPFPDGFGGV